jgi:hypothetical protein
LRGSPFVAEGEAKCRRDYSFARRLSLSGFEFSGCLQLGSCSAPGMGEARHGAVNTRAGLLCRADWLLGIGVELPGWLLSKEHSAQDRGADRVVVIAEHDVAAFSRAPLAFGCDFVLEQRVLAFLRERDADAPLPAAILQPEFRSGKREIRLCHRAQAANDQGVVGRLQPLVHCVLLHRLSSATVRFRSVRGRHHTLLSRPNNRHT